MILHVSLTVKGLLRKHLTFKYVMTGMVWDYIYLTLLFASFMSSVNTCVKVFFNTLYMYGNQFKTLSKSKRRLKHCRLKASAIWTDMSQCHKYVTIESSLFRLL